MSLPPLFMGAQADEQAFLPLELFPDQATNNKARWVQGDL